MTYKQQVINLKESIKIYRNLFLKQKEKEKELRKEIKGLKKQIKGLN